jgi:hypothetical protein
MQAYKSTRMLSLHITKILGKHLSKTTTTTINKTSKLGRTMHPRTTLHLM